jgi:transposase
MSGADLAGVREQPKQAEVTFDRYHVKQTLSEAIDEIRRTEAKEHKKLLKNTRLPVAQAAEERDRRATGLAR